MNRVTGKPKAPSPTGSNGTANGHAGEGRESNGRFTVGNKAAVGNPFARQVATRRKALLDALTPEDIAAVGRKLLGQALGGDVAASKVLLSYAIGKPQPAPDPDRLDHDELGLLASLPIAGLGIMSHMGRVAPALLLEMARQAQVGDRSLLVERLANDIRARNESLGALIDPRSEFDKLLEEELQDEGDDDD
jgi:hypothetical protein